MSFDPKLIIDVGMSEGNDTDFYLKKGFRVVGVEADAKAFTSLVRRFHRDIEENRLQVLHRAASNNSGSALTFWHDSATQGHSSLDRSRGVGLKEAMPVISIAWPELRHIAGLPYFIKIDIEGGESPFLESMSDDHDLPPLISIEAHSFDPVEALSSLGYRYFKLVNQTTLSTFPLPDPPREGASVVIPDWRHCSGAFGRELVGRWCQFSEIAKQFAMIKELKVAGCIFQPWVWFDCHASLTQL